MNGWSPKDYKKNNLAALGASLTDEVISEIIPITAGGARMLVVKFKVSSVTVGGGITAKLQSGIDQEFVDSKTVAITASGNFYIKLLAEAAGDQTYLPLLASARLVVTTGVGSAITIDKISVLQEL